MDWKSVNPIYPTADIDISIEWYRRIFNFEPTLVNPADDVPVYAILCRDNVCIHLLRTDEAPHGLKSPVEAQFVINDGLDELFDHAKAMGAEVIQELDDRPWGHRDFMVADPDGNIVWVSCPLSHHA